MDAYVGILEKMCNLSSISHVAEKTGGAASFMVGTAEFAVPLENLIDAEAEIQRLEKELQAKKGFLESVMRKLSNERFVQNAPKQVVDLELKKKADALRSRAL